MNVTRIHTDGGSHIEPPLDPDWDDHTKLRWKAAVVTHDTGLPIEVNDGGYKKLVDGRWRTIPGRYSIQLPGSSQAAHTFREAWVLLNGIRSGADAARCQPRPWPTAHRP